MPKWWDALRHRLLEGRSRVEERVERLDAKTAVALVEDARAADDDASAERATRRAQTFLEAQCALLERLANGYPAHGGIRGDVWLDGRTLARCGDALADECARRGALSLEDGARLLAIRAACAVMGHYPEEVFPRVLGRGRCNERLQRTAVAVQCYRAIVRDFEALGLDQVLLKREHEGGHEAGDEEGDEEGAQGAERVILEAVGRALERLGELSPADAPSGLGARIAARLGSA